MGGVKMFKEMRRKDRVIDQLEIKEVLEKGKYGFLSTIGDNGYPYVVPLSYIYYNNHIYFHCATEGQKLDHIRQNNKVSFCVVTDTEVLPDKFTTKYKSVIVFGEASEVEENSKEEILFKIIEKYSPAFLIEGKTYIENAKDKTKIIKIEIQNVTGKGRK